MAIRIQTNEPKPARKRRAPAPPADARAVPFRYFYERLGIQRSLANELKKAGLIRTIKIGGKIVVPIEEFDRLLNKGG